MDDGYTALNLVSTEHKDAPTEETLIESWKRKALHGRIYNSISQSGINFDASITWLKKGYLFPETEGFILAIQNQVVPTNAYRKYICGEDISDQCRLCKNATESIQHISSGCQALAGKEYLMRHNNLAKIVHQALASLHNMIKDAVPYYRYEPKPVLSGENRTIYWDRSIITDHTVVNNKPDIVLIDRNSKSGYVIDISVPTDDNVGKTISEKIRKYQDLCQELRQLYRLDHIKVFPIVISSNGLIPDDTIRSVENLKLPEKLLEEGQKAVLLGTANIVRKFLNIV